MPCILNFLHEFSFKSEHCSCICAYCTIILTLDILEMRRYLVDIETFGRSIVSLAKELTESNRYDSPTHIDRLTVICDEWCSSVQSLLSNIDRIFNSSKMLFVCGVWSTLQSFNWRKENLIWTLSVFLVCIFSHWKVWWSLHYYWMFLFFFPLLYLICSSVIKIWKCHFVIDACLDQMQNWRRHKVDCWLQHLNSNSKLLK